MKHLSSIPFAGLHLIVFLVTASISALVAEELKTNIQVLCISPPENTAYIYLNSAQNDQKKSMTQVPISSTRLLDPVAYEGSEQALLLYRPKGKDYQTMASVALPPACKQTVIVLAPAQAHAEFPYQVIALDASLTSFKTGTRQVVNLTEDELRGEMGTLPFKRDDKKNLKFECAPYAVKDVPVLDPVAKPLTSQPVILDHKGKDGEWRMLTTTRWFHTPHQRHLIIVYRDPTRKTLVIHGVTDRVKKK